MNSEANAARKRRQLYGRRKGPRLSTRQSQLIETLLPQLALNLQSGRDPRGYFSNASISDVWLEVGFGSGEHFLWQAERHPHVGHIGAEPYEAGVAKLLSKLAAHPLKRRAASATSEFSPPTPYGEVEKFKRAQRSAKFSGGGRSGDEPPPRSQQREPSVGWTGSRTSPQGGGGLELSSSAYYVGNVTGADLSRKPLSNIRIHVGDARDIVATLPDASLGRVFVLFPDPWPKMRHHKRRFIQMETLSALGRVMKPGAELRFASDDPGYVAWTLECVLAGPSFEWTAVRALDWNSRPDDWPQTRYEVKALHGPPAFLQMLRR